MSSTRTHRRLARTAAAVDSSAPDGTSKRPNDPGGPIRVILASCSFGAAAIHLAMATSHAGEWLAEGIVFAISGWMQLGLAVAFVLRPTRAALLVACVANSVFIAAWAWTRAVGTPFGPEAGSVHDTGLVDLSVVALELAIVLLSALALAIPRPGELTHRTQRRRLHDRAGRRARARYVGDRVAECDRPCARRGGCARSWFVRRPRRGRS